MPESNIRTVTKLSADNSGANIPFMDIKEGDRFLLTEPDGAPATAIGHYDVALTDAYFGDITSDEFPEGVPTVECEAVPFSGAAILPITSPLPGTEPTSA